MKDFIIQILNRAKGDDLYRYQRAFKDLSREMLNEPYGESGKTRQQLLDACQEYEDKINSAILWVKSKI